MRFPLAPRLTRRVVFLRSLFVLSFVILSRISAAAVPSLAISDFDGDHRPDLASVQAGQIDGPVTDYWIELHLTTSGLQSIRLSAPSGGLIIKAQDVNGDHAVDLVLTAVWFRRPVAILLNDGHGSFSQIEPSAFPEAFTDFTAIWASASDQGTQAVAIPPQSNSEIGRRAKRLPSVGPRADLIWPSGPSFLLGPSLSLRTGRAPPSQA